MNEKSLFFLSQIHELINRNRITIRSVLYTDSSRYDWWSYMFHSYEREIEIVYYISGKGTLYRNLAAYPIHEGDVLLKLPCDTFAEYPKEGTSIRKISILMDVDETQDENLRKLIERRAAGTSNEAEPLEDRDYQPVVSTQEYQHFVKEVFMQLFLMHRKKVGVERELRKRLVSSLIEILKLSFLKGEYTADQVDERVLMVAKYIHDHYRDNISLQEISDTFSLSPTYLAKIFKAETGYTVNQYVIHCRIGYAEKILMYERDVNMKELAAYCGFGSVQYFYSIFHRHTLCTPVEYRTRYIQQ